ncbi:hypothetical protein AMES_6638 [Amycolatopsis mediterranei S699]|uniref:Transmembrane protein n=2 Tax=Amycolatopsis mediterranei TaxID=33910 RepID=A0A0H3DEF7_AMYMU|nr:hypothetical protein [Amycolatopsis mediterranei]ADJ48463.1 hypothetical protein AMED_6738 [Amycolatopsis mediterranei U32]AEK45386.1 hypothetical protein RAM_34565 [Amycolatopsis mediterranei S699]AFO80174.1 hypothetical protein AMES_6638 [Amycolatopsis mediterranei S699]AGT87302.1 hypothetical protein B737_6638 [Amycolatopsis mediterranei RB]KDO10980.1 hypothetical protein DV26_10660 [Amycolatopsis mediterranei]
MTADSFPGSGAAPGGVQAPPPPAPEPAGTTTPAGPVLGFRELSERVIASVAERCPWLHRVLMGMLAVFTGTCVVAVVSRLSPLPLLPVPLFVVAAYGLRQARGVTERRQLFNWVLLFALATIVGFWLIAVVGRWVE